MSLQVENSPHKSDCLSWRVFVRFVRVQKDRTTFSCVLLRKRERETGQMSALVFFFSFIRKIANKLQMAGISYYETQETL